jgi:hypothetical protein
MIRPLVFKRMQIFSIWSSAGKIVEGQREGVGGTGRGGAAPVGLREVCIQLFYICMRCLRCLRCMRLHALACACMRLHALACACMRLHALVCNCMRGRGVAEKSVEGRRRGWEGLGARRRGVGFREVCKQLFHICLRCLRCLRCMRCMRCLPVLG